MTVGDVIEAYRLLVLHLGAKHSEEIADVGGDGAVLAEASSDKAGVVVPPCASLVQLVLSMCA